MSEKLIKELEDYLTPYVIDRFDYSNTPFGGIVKSLMGTRGNQIEQYVVWIMRAFIRCIVGAEKDVHLHEISVVAKAEAYSMMQFSPMKNIHNYNAESAGQIELIIEAEIHNWLLRLMEFEKLPGNYNRFTGVYSNGL
ncbi:MAG: hypothetical protein ACTSQB_03045 [Candidatus Heimdallarchaeota archaeon]